MFATFSITLRLGQLIKVAAHVAQFFVRDLVMMLGFDGLVSTISAINRKPAVAIVVRSQILVVANIGGLANKIIVRPSLPLRAF